MTDQQKPWDNGKRDKNIAKYKVDFTAADRLDWVTAITSEDPRHAGQEIRYVT